MQAILLAASGESPEPHHENALKDSHRGRSRSQTFSLGIAIGAETVSASPRGPFTVFFSGALTSTWTAESWTLDKGITVTRVQAQAKTAPAVCTANAVIRLTDRTTAVNVTIAAAAK
jgi:hypothetical protein